MRSSKRSPSSIPRPPAASGQRFDRLDALRGTALVWMAIFHFCFDLSHYGVINADFYRDAVWTTQRTLILSTFLLCAGAGQAIASAQGQSWARFWKRWAQVASCALAVSIGSAFMFPDSFIYFGVLHGMAVMLIIARLSAPLGRWLWALGAVAVALPHFVQHPFFDTRWTNWVGLVTAKPITEDYVPVLPWLGVMWWGLAATQWLLARHPGWLAGATAPPARGLALLGRWSLTFYMVHQPLLLGGLMLWLDFWRTPS
ncbi:MAG: heparan-alpha-glucosaminide N-acetyltransferase [Aquabacterium sp.]|uniref:heparan-alpha-glucosaminide N-acetyltransferase n=1 Tax=Aquabacterium sp. TaxID=1872578 RepID=UPI003BB1FCE1